MRQFQKSKGNTALILLVIILSIVAIGSIATAIYFWQKSSKTATVQTSPKITAIAQVTPVATKSAISKVSPTATPVEQTPTEVVDNFMKHTLLMLPGAVINYDLARQAMTNRLKANYSGDDWAPLFYGIQDGPTSVKFISENIVGDSATVRFDPSWGEMSLGWSFSLVKEGNKWLIDDFRNDAQ